MTDSKQIQQEQLNRVLPAFQHFLYENERTPQQIKRTIVKTLGFVCRGDVIEGANQFVFQLINFYEMMDAIEYKGVFEHEVLELGRKRKEAVEAFKEQRRQDQQYYMSLAWDSFKKSEFYKEFLTEEGQERAQNVFAPYEAVSEATE